MRGGLLPPPPCQRTGACLAFAMCRRRPVSDFVSNIRRDARNAITFTACPVGGELNRPVVSRRRSGHQETLPSMNNQANLTHKSSARQSLSIVLMASSAHRFADDRNRPEEAMSPTQKVGPAIQRHQASYNNREPPILCPITRHPCEGDLAYLCEDYGCARKGGLSPHSDENL
jgi:hypothetical protein